MVSVVFSTENKSTDLLLVLHWLPVDNTAVLVDESRIRFKIKSMRKLFVVLTACFFALSARSQTTVAQVNDIDKITGFTNINYDFGRIPSHKPVEYNVTIKNTGKDTLVLKEVKAGCGCTTPKYRANEKILPGRSTFITLGFNGDAVGQFERTVDILFNDGSLVKQAKFHGVAVADSTTTNIQRR